ncbi:putative heterogeneous nuclear ribonucleoprotein U-like protein 1-like [Daphnia sinensis]|uniref:Heterogeneous nuclear ribonucleoprotein U-like protein 1-like n=1 Tax=Daphnia sinensis TaxID=1820382 RepID=A0AAD5KSN9_9CRUS|nr:putative heterogeneous nuclear ribonucleoprotein U-like protein 1-like [Daphnia sinensis]
MTKFFYCLVGVPASGKSTFIKRGGIPNSHECVYVSSDKFIDDEATRTGKTYNDVFDDYIKTAIGLMLEEAECAKKEYKNVIWDQTSLTPKNRKTKIDMFKDYYKIAVVFPVPEKEEHDRRLNFREGKIIPHGILKSMIETFTPPTIAEGFNEIWTVGVDGSILVNAVD